MGTLRPGGREPGRPAGGDSPPCHCPSTSPLPMACGDGCLWVKWTYRQAGGAGDQTTRATAQEALWSVSSLVWAHSWMTSCDFQPNVFLPSPHLLVLSPQGAISRSFKGSSYSSSIRAWDLKTSGQGQGGIWTLDWWRCWAWASLFTIKMGTVTSASQGGWENKARWGFVNKNGWQAVGTQVLLKSTLS